jgi:hypothetical protein
MSIFQEARKRKREEEHVSFFVRSHTILLIASYWPELCHMIILLVERLGNEVFNSDSLI